MKFVPSLISPRIERGAFIKDEADEPNPIEVAQEEERQRQAALLNRIKTACSHFKGACPEQWEHFEQDMNEIYGIARTLDAITPQSMMRQQETSRNAIDPGYYALIKSYTSAQIEILDSILKVLPIKPAAPRSSMPEKKSKNLLTWFRNVLNRHQV